MEFKSPKHKLRFCDNCWDQCTGKLCMKCWMEIRKEKMKKVMNRKEVINKIRRIMKGIRHIPTVHRKIRYCFNCKKKVESAGKCARKHHLVQW